MLRVRWFIRWIEKTVDISDKLLQALSNTEEKEDKLYGKHA